MQRPEPLAGLAGPAGRREGLGGRTRVRQGGVRQRQRGAERRRQAARAPDHHQGQAAGDAEGCVRGHAEAHQAHPGAAVPGDRPQHEGDPGEQAVMLSG